MNIGEQRRLFHEGTISHEENHLTTYTHDNGVVVVTNTEHNLKTLPKLLEYVTSTYTVIDSAEREPEPEAPGAYYKYLLLLQNRVRRRKCGTSNK
ncbi:hypothetical protein NEDG_00635 [Nematocida displodere]|uniref:Uncharacterized protein n=1 Tax=Nematocida displodere TaxID=1805483 RepID=A0A177EED1_9MICR|nr:hypothetical protein NEDG_00635 [Nematocida displodere]